MSKQTDELLMLHTMERQAETEVVVPEVEISAARDKLRAMYDLKQKPGYTVFLEAMQFEVESALQGMDKADNPTKMARYSGEHFAATMATRYVDNEIQRLERLLSASRKP